MTAEHRLRDVLGTPVGVLGERVGYVSGVLLDASESRALGLEIMSPDLVPRFLPWVAAAFDDDGRIDAHSAFLLIDSCEPYLEHGAVLTRDQERIDRIADEVSRVALVGTEDLVIEARHVTSSAASPVVVVELRRSSTTDLGSAPPHRNCCRQCPARRRPW